MMSNKTSGGLVAGFKKGMGNSAFPSVLHSGTAPDTFESLPQHIRKGIGNS